MFIACTVATFISPEGTAEDSHSEVLRTAAIVRVRPASGVRSGATRVTVAEVGDLFVLEAYPAFLARLWRSVGYKPPEVPA